MTQEIAATLPSEDLSAIRVSESLTAQERVSSKAGARWIPPVERMPPIVQFAVKLAGWCRAKCKTDRKAEAPLRMIGQLPLGGKRHLALVEAGGMQFLVGGGAEHVTVIVPVGATAGVKLDDSEFDMNGEFSR